MAASAMLTQAYVNSVGDVQASPAFDVRFHDELKHLRETLSSSLSNDQQALFVRFLDKRTVLIGTVRGQELWARVILKVLYEHLPDPFFFAEYAPADWVGKSPVDLPLDQIQRKPRTIEQLQRVLKEGDGPFLYGGCQTLVDYGKILIQRDVPDEKSIRDLWQLLPRSIQATTTFTTFADDNRLGFDFAVLKQMPETHPGYLNEDQARDYPESRYERELQLAIESNDEHALQMLLNRRSSIETLKLAFSLVIGMAIISVAARILLR